ncbi:MAG: hypothetical protein LUI12_11010, partial [Clostridiales bacterium]|nr:hypothetical protein [Clostridiales bacterium]
AYAYIVAKQDLTILDILTASEYEIELDSEFTGKSTVTTARKPTYEQGDYIFLKNSSGTFYKGVIDTVDNTNGESKHTLNCLEIENIFDQKIVISEENLINETGIEDFIALAIEENFVSSDDALLNLDYITVVVSTHPPIAASVDTDDGGIFNLLTYIGNAREYYGIFLDFEFTGKALTISISKKDQETFKFDSTVSDVDDYDEVYSVDVLAKLTAVWSTSEGVTTILKRYLKTDRTTTDDVDDPDRAVGSSDTIYIECDTEDEALQEIANEFKSNSYKHSVTANVRRSSLIYPESAFYVGHECEIKTVSHGIKDSMITNVSYSNDSEYIAVKFGNMAVTLIEKLRKERS